MNRNGSVFYGWWITFALFIAGMLAFGGGVYAFTIFLPALEVEFGWGRAVTGGAVSVLWLSAPLLPLIGFLTDRYGARPLVSIGLAITGVLYMCMFFVQSAWQLYAVRILMGVGKLLVFIATPTSAARWFNVNLGIATGVMLAGTHVGGFLLAPVAQYFIDSWGWRFAAVVLGATILVVGLPPALWFLRWNKPEDLGLLPDGVEPNRQPGTNESDTAETYYGYTLRQALKLPPFWVIGGLMVIYYYGMSAVLFQQTSVLTDLAVDAADVAKVVAAVAIIAMVACPISGAVFDRLNTKKVLAGMFLLQGLAVSCLLLFRNDGDWHFLYLYVVLLGIHLGGADVGFCVLVREQFGNKYYGSIFGTSYLFIVSMLISGSIIAGYVYDMTGSYVGGFSPIIVGALVAVIVIGLFVRPPAWDSTGRVTT